jgi:hypothetical protein
MNDRDDPGAPGASAWLGARLSVAFAASSRRPPGATRAPSAERIATAAPDWPGALGGPCALQAARRRPHPQASGARRRAPVEELAAIAAPTDRPGAARAITAERVVLAAGLAGRPVRNQLTTSLCRPAARRRPARARPSALRPGGSAWRAANGGIIARCVTGWHAGRKLDAHWQPCG